MISFLKKKNKKHQKYLDTTQKNNSNIILAPASGRAISLSEVSDEVFSQKLAGDGMAILIDDDIIVAPANGVISLIFKTKHAFSLTLDNGVELLVHIGINTVTLNGEGFEKLCIEGQKVTAGTPIIKVNRKLLLNKDFSLATPVLITNLNSTQKLKAVESGLVKSNETPVIVLQ